MLDIEGLGKWNLGDRRGGLDLDLRHNCCVLVHFLGHQIDEHHRLIDWRCLWWILWVADKDFIDIYEYEVMLEGAVSVCCGEIVFVMARLGLRRIHAASEENGVK